MWNLICENEFPDQLTILVNWIKTNNHNTQQHTQTTDVK